MARARGALLIALMGAGAGCTESDDSPEPPTMEEIAEMVQRECDAGYACGDWGTEDEVAALIEECKMETGLWERLTLEGNPECGDVWLVYDFHDCRANLGCSDYQTSPDAPVARATKSSWRCTMRTAIGSRALRFVGPMAGILGVACGPRLAPGTEADDEFLSEAEKGVDMFCVHHRKCDDWWNENRSMGEERYSPVFAYTSECYDPLLNATERIYAGDRCVDPEAILVLYDCLTAISCPSYELWRHPHESPCAAEYQEVEAALCNPF